MQPPCLASRRAVVTMELQGPSSICAESQFWQSWAWGGEIIAFDEAWHRLHNFTSHKGSQECTMVSTIFKGTASAISTIFPWRSCDFRGNIYIAQCNSYPLHGDVTFGYFRIRPFDRRHGGGQKCITVIERKALIVSLLTNASDYSSETTIFVRYKHIDLSMQVLLE